MSQFQNQNQYPATTTTEPTAPPPPPPSYAAYSAPPPPGYPTRDGASQTAIPVETKSKGDGFWKGCCAAMCCCCMLEACF